MAALPLRNCNGKRDKLSCLHEGVSSEGGAQEEEAVSTGDATGLLESNQARRAEPSANHNKSDPGDDCLSARMKDGWLVTRDSWASRWRSFITSRCDRLPWFSSHSADAVYFKGTVL
ncbi:hypothetical protein JZ751_013582 [Albula glossodonta]|uniref:Uncharacterized protein n=1 Tax=Albula glossodonta TaxID=121402 RepID=A0A8T2P195_9TELE|nr:hypothetical protein JZ751_013582 [Albula glossodonta]